MPSQYGQDYFVLEVLGWMRDGFFLDSGAADGITSSNTYLLEKTYGWSGICVEPNESFFASLVRNRKCECVNCCIYDREGEVDFLESARMLGGILSEYDPRHLQFAKSTFKLRDREDGRPPSVRKPAHTLRSILREHRAPSVIDYWSLDTEGSELAILKSFPFDEYSFRVLTVEHNWLPVREEIHAFLTSRGYVRVRTLQIDDCYMPRSAALPMTAWRSAAWRRRR